MARFYLPLRWSGEGAWASPGEGRRRPRRRRRRVESHRWDPASGRGFQTPVTHPDVYTDPYL